MQLCVFVHSVMNQIEILRSGNLDITVLAFGDMYRKACRLSHGSIISKYMLKRLPV